MAKEKIKLKKPDEPKPPESIDAYIDRVINAPMEGENVLLKLEEVYRIQDLSFPQMPPRSLTDIRWDPEIAKKILILRAYGWSAKRIEALPGMPSRITIGTWKKDKPEFGAAWDEYFEMSLDIEAEDIIPIADNTRASKEAVMLSKLRILARQFSAGRRFPAKWGQQGNGNTAQVIIQHAEIVKKDSQTDRTEDADPS